MGGAFSLLAYGSTRDSDQAIVGVSSPIADIPPGDAAGQPNKREGSPPVFREGKRFKYLDNGGDKQSIEESQSRLFLCHPTEAARGDVLDPCGIGENVHDIRPFKLDGVKHKIFLSHSGKQKGFVEQLCVDLEARGYLFPFFDQRHHSLPKGESFVPLIREAAQVCQVAVIVLSKEFLCSKWPMIELGEFHDAQQAGNKQLKILPLFYKLSVGDLDDESIEKCWMPLWVEHAKKDKRIDVGKWSAAVRAVRGSNGVIFHKNVMSKVGYRKDVVQCISRLSPPELLYGSSGDMVGCDRMCETVSNRFVKDSRVGALVLGLYGTSGAGKSTLVKALCNHFCREFVGRVCYVELDEMSRMCRMCHLELGGTSRMERTKLILERLCGFDVDMLHKITDICQGLRQMRELMKREPVFLAIDNVTNAESLCKEAFDYLMVGFHPESRIMVTSRSKCVVEDLLPDVRFCMPMPRLSAIEAGEIFLGSAAPMKPISGLTDEERRILGLCIKQCLFESDQDGSELKELTWLSCRSRESFHPLALSALGHFFRMYISSCDMLSWGDYLERNEDPLKEMWKFSKRMRSIIGLQFSTLHPSEQLLFLDIALFIGRRWWFCKSRVIVLCGVYDETPTVMERRLRDLVTSGMICMEADRGVGYSDYFVQGLYRDFAEWHVSEHGVSGLKKGSWGVFRTSGAGLRSGRPASKCWSDLVRLEMIDVSVAHARYLGSKSMQELRNLVVLSLHRCPYLTVLNLEGLESLRHLEVDGLTKLEKVTFSGSSSADEKQGIYESLRYVRLDDLDSLTDVPDFRSCTSLQHVFIWRCKNVTNFEGILCPHLEALDLRGVYPHQFESLPNVKSLHSLEHFYLSLMINDEVDPAEDDFVRDFPKMSCFRYVREYFLYLREWSFDVHLFNGRGILPAGFGQVIGLIWNIMCSGKEQLRCPAVARTGKDYSSLTHEAVEQLALSLHPDATALSRPDTVI